MSRGLQPRAPGVLAVLLLALAACGGAGAPISGDSRNVGDLTLTFRVEPARARPGQVVRLSINVHNNAGREHVLRFPSGQRYDFSVRRGGREVWRWSWGQVFPQAEVTERLGGSEARRFTAAWRAGGPGRYRATGALLARGFGGELVGEVVVRE